MHSVEPARRLTASIVRQREAGTHEPGRFQTLATFLAMRGAVPPGTW
jgi:hypothetical protein